MASFYASLSVGSFGTDLDTFTLEIHQKVDSLGRPASPSFSGPIIMSFSTPTDPLISEWMFNPAMQKSGTIKVWEMEGQTLKEINFQNALCTEMEIDFDAGHNSAKLTTTISISPEKIIVSDVRHDNDWAPIESVQ